MLVPIERRYFSFAEQLSRDELEHYQFKKLKRLLEFNYANNKFYRDRWDKARVTPDDINSLADYRHKIPTVEKADVLVDQEECPPLGRRLGVPIEAVRKVHLTSGTSGMAKEAWGLTQTDVELSARGHIQNFHWRGMKPGDVFMSSMPRFFSAGIGASWGAEKFGLISFELFGLPVGQAFPLMQKFSPSMLLYPQAILGRYMRDNGIIPRVALPKLKTTGILSSSFGHSKSSIDEEAELWGTRASENYGCTQATNTVGIVCEHGLSGPDASPMVHFLEERFIVECLNRETGEVAKDGEECEIVLTTLDRVASPSIRYRMHDRTIFMDRRHCPCGRPYHGYQPGTIGRWDDMMKIKGINCWPSAFDAVVLAHPDILEYRGRVWRDDRGTERVEIAISFAQTANPSTQWRQDMLKTVAVNVKERTFVSSDVIESPESLEVFELKPRRWTFKR